MNQSQIKTTYFPALDTIRGAAAIGVLFHHLELFKKRDGIISLFDLAWLKTPISIMGKECVYLFFCLSGFLLT